MTNLTKDKAPRANVDNRTFKQQVQRVDKVLYEVGVDPEDLEPATTKMLRDPEFYKGMFTGTDPLKALKIVVARVLKLRPVPGIEARNHIVDLLTESYVSQTGELPHTTQLFLLANFILVEDLTCSHPDKVTRTEYPFMNKRQLRIRHKRELPDEFMANRGNEYDAMPDKKNLTMEYGSN